MASVAVDRAELARSGARAAPTAIDHHQVLEHGLRHLGLEALPDAGHAPWLDDLPRCVELTGLFIANSLPAATRGSHGAGTGRQPDCQPRR